MIDPSIVGATRLANGPFQDLYKSVKSKASIKLTEREVDEWVKGAYEQAQSVAYVKTIWNYNEPVHISSFYYPVGLEIDGRAISINSGLDGLPHEHFMVCGTAGQGKSIFLRYLCLQEAQTNNTLPIFIELRRLRQENELIRLLEERFEIWGMDEGAFAFDFLAERGKLTLLLDGFDEIPSYLVVEVQELIESLVEKYPNMRVIVSSRPGSDLFYSYKLAVYQLTPLTHWDVPGVVELITGDALQAKNIGDMLRDRASLTPLFTTPLSVVLLLVVYRAKHNIPESLAEFYDELFPLLFERHDKSKLGLQRNRSCSLSKREMLNCFEALCFCMQLDGVLEANESSFLLLAREALKTMGVEADADSFLKDIVDITCLLVRDGQIISVIHPTVVEYYCARFIRNLSEADAEEFYKGLLELPSWHEWMQVFEFLVTIDPVRAREYYAIPDLERTLCEIDPSDLVASFSSKVARVVNRAIDENSISIDKVGEQIFRSGPSEQKFFEQTRQLIREITKDRTFEIMHSSSLAVLLQNEKHAEVLREEFSRVCDELEAHKNHVELSTTKKTRFSTLLASMQSKRQKTVPISSNEAE